MTEIVDIIMRPQFLVTMLAAVSAFATVLSLAMPLLSRDRMTQRMKMMALERVTMRAARLAEMAAQGPPRPRRRRRPSCARQWPGLHASDRRAIRSAREVRQRRPARQAENGRLARPGATRRLHVFRIAMPVIVFVVALFCFL